MHDLPGYQEAGATWPQWSSSHMATQAALRAEARPGRIHDPPSGSQPGGWRAIRRPQAVNGRTRGADGDCTSWCSGRGPLPPPSGGDSQRSGRLSPLAPGGTGLSQVRPRARHRCPRSGCGPSDVRGHLIRPSQIEATRAGDFPATGMARQRHQQGHGRIAPSSGIHVGIHGPAAFDTT